MPSRTSSKKKQLPKKVGAAAIPKKTPVAAGEPEEPKDWKQRASHWRITTTVAVIALLASATSATAAVIVNRHSIIQFFTGEDDSAPSLSMPKEDFLKLEFGQRIDICSIYLHDHLEEGFAAWKKSLADRGATENDILPIGGLAVPGDGNTDGQALANNLATVEQLAVNETGDRGRNLMTCLYTPSQRWDGDTSEVFKLRNGFPLSPEIATSQSRVFSQGSYAGNLINGRPTVVVDSQSRGTGQRSQTAFMYVIGASDAHNAMWVVLASLLPNDPSWIASLPDWVPSDK